MEGDPDSAGDSARGAAGMAWTVDLADLPDPEPRVITLPCEEERPRPKAAKEAEPEESPQPDQGGAPMAWTIDVKDLRPTRKRPEPRAGKKPLPLKKSLGKKAPDKNAAQPNKSQTDVKKDNKGQPENDENAPSAPMLTENEKKMLERVKGIRADKRNLLDPKIELQGKPKMKAPKMSLSKARVELQSAFLTDGKLFGTEENKINEWYDMFERRFELVERIHRLVPPKYTFERTVTVIKELLAGPWVEQTFGLCNVETMSQELPQQRLHSVIVFDEELSQLPNPQPQLRKLRALTIEISYEPRDPVNEEKMLNLLKELNKKFEDLLYVDRTQLLTEVCITLSFLCREYRNKLEMHYLKIMITSLLHKTHVVNILGNMVKAALKYIYQYVHVPALFLHLMKELEQTKGQKMIISIAYLMLTVIEFWSQEELKPCLEAFEQGFKILYIADVKCHVPLRLVFWTYNRDHPERAKKLYNSLQDLDQILLDACKFLPPKQKPQDELLPPVRRERPLLISEFEDSEEDKKKKLQEIAKEVLPMEVQEESKKDKKKKKKKKKRKYSSTSSTSSDSDSTSSDSSISEEKKRRRKRRKEKRRKELKKLRKLKKLKKRQEYSDSSDSSSSIDMGIILSKVRPEKTTNYLLSLKELPSRFLDLMKKSKKTKKSETELRVEEKMRKKELKKRLKRSAEREAPDVVVAYKMAKEELRSKQEELARLKARLAGAKEELEMVRREAEESDMRIENLEKKSSFSEYGVRRFSDPELHCKSTFQ